MRVAARHGAAWVTNGDRSHRGAALAAAEGVEVVRRQMRLLEASCAEVGRDPATVDRIVLTGPRLDAGLSSPQAFGETRDAYASAGVTDLVVHWPRPDEPYAGDPAILERILR
jgi:hypothetical protein